MDSEPETERRRADPTMIIRPDMRRFTILDILIEFKFVSIKEAGLSGEQARKLSRQKLESLPCIAQSMNQAIEQVQDYSQFHISAGTNRAQCIHQVNLSTPIIIPPIVAVKPKLQIMNRFICRFS